MFFNNKIKKFVLKNVSKNYFWFLGENCHYNFFSKTILNKKLKGSSKRWIERQNNDIYVKRAHKEDYRSRAAFKLIEIIDKHKLLKNNKKKHFNVLDLGACPGSWTQAMIKKFDEKRKKYTIIAVDKDEFEPFNENVKMVVNDFTLPETKNEIHALINDQPIDIVLSDMAPSATGNKMIDHDRLYQLSYEALEIAIEMLDKNGWFLTKFSQGSTFQEFTSEIKCHFNKLKIIKPPASRKQSTEIYLLAQDKKHVI